MRVHIKALFIYLFISLYCIYLFSPQRIRPIGGVPIVDVSIIVGVLVHTATHTFMQRAHNANDLKAF